jgi:P-type Cu+ transporter
MTEPREIAELQLTGMTCVACASRIEKVLNRMPDVSATVNFATEKARIEFDQQNTDLAALIAAVQRAGYDAHPVRDFESEKLERAAAYRQERLRFIISLLLTAPLLVEMILMLPLWLQWLLATPVQFWIGKRLFSGAWHSLRGGGANMDTG